MLRCCLASKDKQFKGLSGGEVDGFLTMNIGRYELKMFCKQRWLF